MNSLQSLGGGISHLPTPTAGWYGLPPTSQGYPMCEKTKVCGVVCREEGKVIP